MELAHTTHSSVRADTILWLTVTEGEDEIIC